MYVYNLFSEPCVRFEETLYNVVESEEKVEVCVITCSGISDEVIQVHVFGYANVSQIPPGSALASKLITISIVQIIIQVEVYV